jgi:hypothetical protein
MGNERLIKACQDYIEALKQLLREPEGDRSPKSVAHAKECQRKLEDVKREVLN